jgi:two-component system sensor histidine kinase PilS (NtrC family)
MLTQPNPKAYRQWKMLLIYDIYRMVSIALLIFLFWLSDYNQLNNQVFNLFLFLYISFAFLCFYFWYHRLIQFEQQVLWCGTVDIIAIALCINLIANLESGLGVILYVSVAVLSILIPGRIAIYFASIASVTLLLVNVVDYTASFKHDLSQFFMTGIYGAGFFATAITTCYLAGRVRASEVIAEQWGKELISILRIGEYFVEQLKNGVIYVESDGKVKLVNNIVRQYFKIKKSSLPCAFEQVLPQLYSKYKIFVTKHKKRNEYAKAMMTDLNLRLEFFSVSIGTETSVLILLERMTDIEQQAQQFKLASLGRFSASIAHELRNPLGIISHAIQLMGDKNPLDDEALRLKELIVNNCNRMNQVIKNVLQLSRMQSAIPEPIDLIEFLNVFKHEFCLINQCDILIERSKRKKMSVFFDKSQLNQILVILCDNAVQHGVDSKGEVHISLHVEYTQQGVILDVKDTGNGVPQAHQELIFEPFFTTLISGTGMGLFIAKDLCQVNAAQIALKAVKNGCCFSILFNHHHEIQL